MFMVWNENREITEARAAGRRRLSVDDYLVARKLN
jgi:hypothetical protein